MPTITKNEWINTKKFDVVYYSVEDKIMQKYSLLHIPFYKLQNYQIDSLITWIHASNIETKFDPNELFPYSSMLSWVAGWETLFKFIYTCTNCFYIN